MSWHPVELMLVELQIYAFALSDSKSVQLIVKFIVSPACFGELVDIWFVSGGAFAAWLIVIFGLRSVLVVSSEETKLFVFPAVAEGAYRIIP